MTDSSRSASDDDSSSLLCDPNTCQSRGAAEDMEISDLDPQVGNKEQKKEMEMAINRPKPPESGISCRTRSATGSANSTSQLENTLQCRKIPKMRGLYKIDAKGETLLHKACKGNNLVRIKALIQAGVSVNMQDYAGWTALHEASVVGEEAVVEELLKAGANVNPRSCSGVTPLHDAVACGHYQVVKLLLRHGADTSDRHVAVEMAEENIKELLLTHQASSLQLEQPGEAPGRHRPAGDTSSEAHCQSSSSLSHNDRANVQSRDSGNGDGAREPGDIQLRKKDTISVHLSRSHTVTEILEEVERKHTEISTWPQSGPEDAERYHAALTHIQNMLIEALAKQQLDKDDLDVKYRSMSDCLRQRVLKRQLAFLASRQRTLVKVLQKQMHLVEVFLTMKAQLFTQPPNNPNSTVTKWNPEHISIPASTLESSKECGTHSCYQESRLKEGERPLTKTSLLKSALLTNAEDFTRPIPPAPLLSHGKKSSAHADVLNKKAGSSQNCFQRPGSTVQHINFQVKGNSALIHPRVEDNSRHLSKLTQCGVLPSGSTLQLLLKGHWHLAHVLGDGLIKDHKGRVHLAPERWLESILDNNIPVSSAYAWDKVMFRDKPLSYYLLNMEAEVNTSRTCPVDVQHCKAGSSHEALPTEAANLNHLMKIKIIHLVDDEELLPNALLDYYWEKLVMNDNSESEDWGSEFK